MENSCKKHQKQIYHVTYKRIFVLNFVQKVPIRVYNGGAMNKRRGFTLSELVVTIGVIGIGTAMVISTIVSLSRIQGASADLSKKNEELNAINDICGEYVSFVSLKTDDISFSYTDSDSSHITFTEDTYNFSLLFNEPTKALLISSNYDGDVEYLKKSNSFTLKYFDSVAFAFDSEINLLSVNVSFGSQVNHFNYVVRV